MRFWTMATIWPMGMLPWRFMDWAFLMPCSCSMGRHAGVLWFFDVADLVKDGWILPLAFSHAAKGSSDQVFRGEVIDRAQRWEILDHLFTFLSEESSKVL
jgi:CRISPR-associated protein Cas1